MTASQILTLERPNILLGQYPATFYQQFQACWESKYETKDCHEETTDLTITIW